MIDAFEIGIHNQFRESIIKFKEHSPHLKTLKNLPLIYRSPLLDEPTFHIPGIYVLTGCHQVGKSTFLKQLILDLLMRKETHPKAILFISSETIVTHQILRKLIKQFYNPLLRKQYLFIDEVNDIPGWEITLKYLADLKFLKKMVIILTGSDRELMPVTMENLADYRGKANKLDFCLEPLSFKEFVCLKSKELIPLCDKIADLPLTVSLPSYKEKHNVLSGLLHEYLLHGGFLAAINDYEINKTISKELLVYFMYWLIKEMSKKNKTEHYLAEIFKNIKLTYNQPVSMDTLKEHSFIRRNKTISVYCKLLESIHVLNIQDILHEKRIEYTVSNRKKILYRDPFIAHAISHYLDSHMNIKKISEKMKNDQFASDFLETIILAHCRRCASPLYIEGLDKQITLAVKQNNSIIPIRLKWSNNFNSADIKQIPYGKKGLILTQQPGQFLVGQDTVLPLVRFLIHTSAGQLQL